MRTLLLLVVVLSACSNGSEYLNKVKKEQERKNAEFANPDLSPLDSAEIKTFKGLHFYEPDASYYVDAEVIWLPQISYLNLPHTGGNVLPYMQTAMVRFQLNGQSFELGGYQTDEMKAQHILFVPFTDETNQSETYGGGRYIDLPYVDNHNQLKIDFNYAYFPYCAYTPRYSCPKVPAQNHLAIKVKAGERL